MKPIRLLFLPLILFAMSCSNSPTDSAKTTRAGEETFGMIGKDTVTKFILSNTAGMKVSILNYGGTVTSVMVPDKKGAAGDVVLGYDSLSGYLQTGNPYFGCLVGRYGNRIAKGKFTIDGVSYQLPLNNNGNTLHGGLKGLDKVIWKAQRLSDSSLQLNYTSADGDQGFPGNLAVEVVYTVTADNALKIQYKATTDKTTPVNLTNHCYFNLSAGSDSTILNHAVSIDADRYTAVDSLLIPTGQLPDVKGTPMDFKTAKQVGKEIAQVKGGYDHNWVLNNNEGLAKPVAVVYDASSGRQMEVFTTEPGLQFYTGNFLDGTLKGGKGGQKYVQHAGFCMETQHFPDGPNQPSFPNTLLKPGETYQQTTMYKFSVR